MIEKAKQLLILADKLDPNVRAGWWRLGRICLELSRLLTRCNDDERMEIRAIYHDVKRMKRHGDCIFLTA